MNKRKFKKAINSINETLVKMTAEVESVTGRGSKEWKPGMYVMI